GIGFLNLDDLLRGEFKWFGDELLLEFQQAVKFGSHTMLDEDALDRRAADRDTMQLEMLAEADTAPGWMLEAQRDNPLDHLGRRRLRMRLVNGREVLEPLEPLELKAALVVVELGPGHAALPAGHTHIAQSLGELQHAEPLASDLLARVHTHRPRPLS